MKFMSFISLVWSRCSQWVRHTHWLMIDIVIISIVSWDFFFSLCLYSLINLFTGKIKVFLKPNPMHRENLLHKYKIVCTAKRSKFFLSNLINYIYSVKNFVCTLFFLILFCCVREISTLREKKKNNRKCVFLGSAILIANEWDRCVQNILSLQTHQEPRKANHFNERTKKNANYFFAFFFSLATENIGLANWLIESRNKKKTNKNMHFSVWLNVSQRGIYCKHFGLASKMKRRFLFLLSFWARSFAGFFFAHICLFHYKSWNIINMQLKPFLFILFFCRLTTVFFFHFICWNVGAFYTYIELNKWDIAFSKISASSWMFSTVMNKMKITSNLAISIIINSIMSNVSLRG